jgi:hypothetical protein
MPKLTSKEVKNLGDELTRAMEPKLWAKIEKAEPSERISAEDSSKALDTIKYTLAVLTTLREKGLI